MRAWLRRNGLTLATGALGAAGTLAGLAGSVPSAAIGIAGIIVTVTLQIRAADLESGERAARSTRAMAELGELARRYRNRIASEPAYGGTSVFSHGEHDFDQHRLATEIRAARFDFLEGHRQGGWRTLGTALRDGRADFVSHAGAIDGLPGAELKGVRTLGDLGEQAARRAFAVASDYAGYNVDMASAAGRYGGPDRNADISMNASYHDLADDLDQLATGLDRLITFAPNPGLEQLHELQGR